MALGSMRGAVCRSLSTEPCDCEADSFSRLCDVRSMGCCICCWAHEMQMLVEVEVVGGVDAHAAQVWIFEKHHENHATMLSSDAVEDRRALATEGEAGAARDGRHRGDADRMR